MQCILLLTKAWQSSAVRDSFPSPSDSEHESELVSVVEGEEEEMTDAGGVDGRGVEGGGVVGCGVEG